VHSLSTLYACILSNPAFHISLHVSYLTSCQPWLDFLIFSETVWYFVSVLHLAVMSLGVSDMSLSQIWLTLAVESSLHSVTLALMGLLYLSLDG